MAGQVVQITINVTDGNAAEAVQQVVAQLEALGPAGEAAGAKAGAGLDQVGDHALSARENVRLLNEDLGLRIPRAMQSVIANSQMLSGAIGMIGPALIAGGAVDIFAHMAEGTYNLYNKYISIGAAQDEFLKKLDESKDKDFMNVHSIETARLRIDEATAAMNGFQGAAQAVSHSGWGDILSGNFGLGIGELLSARQMAGAGARAAGQTQELSPEEQSLLHQQRLQQVDSDHAGDSELKGQSKITAELQKQLEINKEKQQYAAIEDREKGNPGRSDSGAATRVIEDAAAYRKAAAEKMAQHREETNQIIQMQNEATNAGLAGNALRAAQELEAIDAITRKFNEGEISKQTAAAETAATQAKFAAEALKLQQQLDEQTRHMADEAAQAGLTGAALLASQLRTQLDSIDAAESKAVGPGGIETAGQKTDFNSQRASARQSFNQKGIEEQTQYEERIRSLMQSSDSYELQGYARIEAEMRKHLEELEAEDKRHFATEAEAEIAFAAQQTQVEADAAGERQRLHQRTMEQITKEEEQAARLTAPEWEQALLAIEDQYVDRVRKIEEDVRQHVMTEQEGATASAAAWQVANAQIQKSEEETRDKVASGLQQMFSNPAQFFEKRAMDTAFQMMATDMMSMFQGGSTGGGMLQYLFGMGPQMSLSTNPQDQIESVLGMGKHGTHGLTSALSSTTSPGMVEFQQGSTTLLAGSNALLQAATTLQSGGMGGLGLPGGGGSGTAAAGGFGGASGTGLPMLPGGSGGADWGAGASPFGSPAMVAGGAAGDYSSSIGDGSAMGSGDLGSQTAGAASSGAWGKIGGVAGGAFTAGMGAFSAYQNSDPLTGALAGAAGGAEIGSIFGPAGTVIGAVVGGLTGMLAGVFGDQGKGKAQDYDKQTVQPGIISELSAYNKGETGYNQAEQYFNEMQISAKAQAGTWGDGALNWYNAQMVPEINIALAQLAAEEKGGRSKVSLSAAQYHTGGMVGGFGDFATGPDEGFAKLLAHEFVVQPMAAQAHAPLLSAINAGNVSYASAVQPRMPASSAQAAAPITIQAWDGASVDSWLRNGGATKLRQGINMATGQYGGSGIR